ncbi:MAG: acyl-CoA dehydrogenase [Rhodocyclaceae bacterium]
MMTKDGMDFSQWIGRTDVSEDDMSLMPALAASATLNDGATQIRRGDALPPIWHWFYFLPKAPQNRIDVDGHPQRGGFLPPIPYPRRMFAGARLRFHRPLVVGEPARREGIIRNVTLKSGRSGSLAFVSVAYTIHQSGALCIEEEQDIVYREPGPAVEAPRPAEWAPLPPESWSRIVTPNPPLLFRFSALTFNSHRIHYDRPYAMGEEGYPGLVVHGPLTAVLLMEMVREHASRAVIEFSFRGLAPLFDLAPFRLVGTPADHQVDLLAQGPDGGTAMTATATLG